MSFSWPTRRLVFRITLPFTLLFAVISLLTWASSTLLVGHFFDAGLKRQLLRVAAGISQAQYLRNPTMLRQVKEMVAADIVLTDRSGRVISATIDTQTLADSPVAELLPRGGAEESGHDLTVQGEPFRVVFRQVALADQGTAYLSLWQSTASAREFTSSIAKTTGGIALLGIIALALAGYRLARSIGIPVAHLASITERVANGDFHPRAVVRGEDEIATLATAFNKMVDRLQESERRLVDSEKLAAAGQLAAGVAHEIRNPLTSIKMFVQVLQRRMPSAEERNRHTLDLLLTEINRLEQIVEQIVHRARPDDHLALSPLDPVALLEEVLLVCQEGFTAAGIDLERHFDLGPRSLAHLDSTKIKQVFWNILVNAKDAMPHGGTLTMTAQPTAAGMLELSFADTGGGLPAELSPETCFSSFFTTKPEGLGLGLTMSRKIVVRHGGTLSLERRPQGGVRVALLLPLAQPSPAAQGA